MPLADHDEMVKAFPSSGVPHQDWQGQGQRLLLRGDPVHVLSARTKPGLFVSDIARAE
jgi:hypothetical protein